MRRRTIDSQLNLFDQQATKTEDHRRGRISVSQISFAFQCGLSLTAVRSRNFQKHSERLPCPIVFTVQTSDDMEILRRSIRAKALAEIDKLSQTNEEKKSNSIRPIADIDGDDNLPEFDS